MPRKVYIIDNLDCANCAAKIEKKFNDHEAVQEAIITFSTKQLRLTAENPDALIPELIRIARTVEGEVAIYPRDGKRPARKAAAHGHRHGHHEHDHECGCGHHHEHHEHDHECGCGHHHHHHADEVFTSWGVETAKTFSAENIASALAALDDEEKYGVVLRAKGILKGENAWIHFDFVPGEINVREGSAGVTGRLCVIGAKLNEAALMELFGV